MRMPSPHDHITAQLLSSGAHELRNQVATMRSIVRLLDDEDLAGALDDASRSVLIALERAVVAARVELGQVPSRVSLPIDQLLELATRRALREGLLERFDAPPATDGTASVCVPGPWVERLLADLLHHSGSGVTRASSEGTDVLVCVQLGQVLDAPLDELLVLVAGACGGILRLEPGEAQLRLPAGDPINAE